MIAKLLFGRFLDRVGLYTLCERLTIPRLTMRWVRRPSAAAAPGHPHPGLKALRPRYTDCSTHPKTPLHQEPYGYEILKLAIPSMRKGQGGVTYKKDEQSV